LISRAPSFAQRVNATLWLVTGISFLVFAARRASGFFTDPVSDLPSFPLFIVLGVFGIFVGVARLRASRAFAGVYTVGSLLLLVYSGLFVPFPKDVGPVAHRLACLWLAFALWSLALAVTQYASNRKQAAV
jgi:hypothetical protein